MFLLLLILGLAGFAVPAATLAAGGGSAGDQQYTDPFGGSGGGKATKTTATAPAPAPAPAPAATTPPATTPTTSTPAPTGSGTTGTPTAVAATSAKTGKTGKTGKTLPFTGYDGRLAALLGAGLVLGGAGLRIRLRRS